MAFVSQKSEPKMVVVIDQGGSESMLVIVFDCFRRVSVVVNVQSKLDHACNEDQLFDVLIISKC